MDPLEFIVSSGFFGLFKFSVCCGSSMARRLRAEVKSCRVFAEIQGCLGFLRAWPKAMVAERTAVVSCAAASSMLLCVWGCCTAAGCTGIGGKLGLLYRSPKAVCSCLPASASRSARSLPWFPVCPLTHFQFTCV